MAEARSETELSHAARLSGVFALLALIHAPLLRYGLIYDDGWTLRSNGFLQRSEFSLALLFSPEAAARHVPDAFRPTLVMFDALSLRLFELRAAAHHGLSIALHLAVCALLERLLARLGARAHERLAAVVCFGLLAIHAEAVTVISFREDLLAACLGLAGVLAVLRSGDEGGSRAASLAWGLSAALLEALACGAKLSAAPLPALLLLLAWLKPGEACRRWASSRRRVAVAVGWLSLGVALALLQTWVVYGGSPYGVANPRVLASRLGLAPILAASTQIHLSYLQQIIVPFGLSPEYVDRGASWSDLATVFSCIALLGLAIAAFVGRRRWPLASFAYLGWLLLCIPTSNLVGMPNMRADRFMYLPSVPVCVALVFGLLALGRRIAPLLPELGAGEAGEAAESDEHAARFDPRAWLPLAAFVLLQGSFRMAEARVYVSNTTLWHEAARRQPDSARAHALLGLERVALAQQSERPSPELMEAGSASCELAEHLDPDYELPALCLGSLAIAQKDWVAAYEHHARAVEVSIDRNDRPMASLAQLSLDLPSSYFTEHPELGDRRQLSRTWLERGLREYPYSPELHAAAARIYHRLGDAERARLMYRRARSLRPDRWETVAGGVELALDLGDAAAAYRTWWAEAELLGRADPATRTRLRRRLAAARRDPDFSLLHSLFSPGVFPHEP